MNFLRRKTTWTNAELGLIKAAVLSAGLFAGIVFHRQLSAIRDYFFAAFLISAIWGYYLWFNKMKEGRTARPADGRQGTLEAFAHGATVFSGTTPAFVAAVLVLFIWAVTGPFFNYSDTWQLFINTFTTVITFLMVFLIQRMQNKDSRAIHLKLNELVAALQGPSNRLVDVEELSEAELETLSRYYRKLARLASKEKDLSVSHSVEEAKILHQKKYKRNKK